MLSEAGHPALAAIELEAAGAAAAARLEWERALRDPRLVGRPYETALAHFNLGEALLRLDERAARRRASCTIAERMLEAVADDFESRGEHERAFDCYGVLLRLGKDIGSFENVAEGYLNAIRLSLSGDHTHAAQYYDDFLPYAIEQQEWYAAATLAREAAEHSLKSRAALRPSLSRSGPPSCGSRPPAHNQVADGPARAHGQRASRGDRRGVVAGRSRAAAGALYGELAALPLPEARSQRYSQPRGPLRRRAGRPQRRRRASRDYLRRTDAYLDIWRQDLIEWELDGDPTAVLARLAVGLPERTLIGPPGAARAAALQRSGLLSRNEHAGAASWRRALGTVQPTRCCARSSGCTSTRPRRCARR